MDKQLDALSCLTPTLSGRDASTPINARNTGYAGLMLGRLNLFGMTLGIIFCDALGDILRGLLHGPSDAAHARVDVRIRECKPSEQSKAKLGSG